jgi:hypothetical protein
MATPFEYATEEHDNIHEAVKAFARAVGHDITDEGGKQFARVVMVALAEAAFEEIFSKVLRQNSSRFGAKHPSNS